MNHLSTKFDFKFLFLVSIIEFLFLGLQTSNFILKYGDCIVKLGRFALKDTNFVLKFGKLSVKEK